MLSLLFIPVASTPTAAVAIAVCDTLDSNATLVVLFACTLSVGGTVLTRCSAVASGCSAGEVKLWT